METNMKVLKQFTDYSDLGTSVKDSTLIIEKDNKYFKAVLPNCSLYKQDELIEIKSYSKKALKKNLNDFIDEELISESIKPEDCYCFIKFIIDEEYDKKYRGNFFGYMNEITREDMLQILMTR